MKIENIGIMSPGAMGHAIARQLRKKGLGVYTALDNRSERTRTLAREAGMTDVGSVAKLVATCDAVLAILDPAYAPAVADAVAQALTARPRELLYADCNAIAPETMRAIDAKITAAGGRCVDACILEPPPTDDHKVWLYFAGNLAHEFEQLAAPSIGVRVVSDRIGDASAIKMCLCAANKGRVTMMVEILVAAQRLGVAAEVGAKLRERHPDFLDEIIAELPKMPPKAYRLSPEMHEVARTFKAVGLPPRLYQGAADVYDMVAKTPIGKETFEQRDRNRRGEDIIRLLAEFE
jgi:3-hydroxyisobutyrate dehydrogenase-like beta-hydroxyacid dehydrogenase